MNNKIRVLMVGPSREEKGGISSVVNQYFDAGLDKLVDLYYISTMVNGGYIVKLICFIKGVLEYTYKIKKYDIVHIHMASRSSYKRKKYFLKIAKLLNVKVIIHLHGAEFKEFYNVESNFKQQNDIQKTFAIADKVIALSEEWKEFLSEICNDGKIITVYNSVRIPFKVEKNYKNDDMLFLGRLGERKGIYDLLDVLPQIIENNNNMHFYVGGDGDVEKCRLICIEKGIENNITFLGWVSGSEKKDLLEKCSIFVLPSYNEGMPVSLLEAMSYGLAVISTNVGGIPKVIDNGKNGLLINPGDKANLFDCLENLIGNVAIKKVLGNAAYETVYHKFNVDKTMGALFSIYEEIYKN